MDCKGKVFIHPASIHQNDIVYLPDIIEPVSFIEYDDYEPKLYFEGDGDDDYFFEDDVLWCGRNDTPEELISMLYEEGCRYVYRKGDYIEIASAFAWCDDRPKAQGKCVSSTALLKIFPNIPDHKMVPLLSLIPPFKPKYAEGELVYDARNCRIGIISQYAEKSPGIFTYQLLGEDLWADEYGIVWGSAQIERYTLPQALKDQYFKYNAGIGWRRGEDTIKVLPI